MEKVRQIAFFCVGRAVMFGWLAIGCIMFSLAFNPVMAFRSGAVLALVMSSVLLVKAYGAGRKNPRSTEVWIYLDERTRPMNDQARYVFCNIMREVYGRFARGNLVVACVLFMLSLAFLGLGFEPTITLEPRIVRSF